MVLALIIVAIALIALYIYFWYITIPVTIIIIVTIWWYNKRCNRNSSTEYSENTLDKSEAYEILGLAVTATIQQVKEKYRELALKWHPDRNMKNKTQAEKMFVKINLAYETIMAAAWLVEDLQNSTKIFGYKL